MSTTKLNIKDFPRGTTPPFTLRFRDDQTGEPYSLEGTTVVMVVREEEWEDSLTDLTALIKRRATFYRVASFADLSQITSPQVGDIAWLDDTQSAVSYDGTTWVEINTNENRITEGLYTIRFQRSETMLTVGRYYYSIDAKFPNEEIVKIVKGFIDITSNTVNEI